MLVVEPSPKFQNRLVIVPVEVSVNVTRSGLSPDVGLPTKLALGTMAPTPITELVLLPPLAVVIITALLKLPALAGEKRTSRFVELKPGKLKGDPDRMVKAPALTVATPLDKGASPRLLKVKLAWVLVPTTTVPKSMPAGETDNCAGRIAVPVTVLKLLPPLLRKTTALL